MNDTVETALPHVELASKDWVRGEDIDTERRIERAFHEQTQFMMQQFANQNLKIDSQTKWLVGLMITMTVAILVAVLFK